MAEPSRLPDLPLLDELTQQLDRTRRLLTGSSELAAERALAGLARHDRADARIAAQLAATQPLAYPEGFPDAHRLAMRALEVLDREGSREPRVPALGPFTPLAEQAVEFVARYIVKSYAGDVAGRLKTLYARRESQSPAQSPERRLLARARVDVERVAPGYGGGSGLPALVAGGAAVPVLASVGQRLGALNLADKRVVVAGPVLLFVLFFSLSWVLLRGAAVAHHRARLIMQQPLAALWEAVGNCGTPPEDDSQDVATLAIALTALGWFAVPLALAAGLLL